MYLTWIAIIASLLTGIGSVPILFCDNKNRDRHSANPGVSASARLKTSLQELSK
jgi:hypothetical protein